MLIVVQAITGHYASAELDLLGTHTLSVKSVSFLSLGFSFLVIIKQSLSAET